MIEKTKRVRLTWVGLVFLGIWLAACHRYVPDQRPAELQPVPAAFSLYPGEERHPDKWWLDFGDAQLNRLIQTALEQNLSLKERWARLDQARALAVKAGAPQLPSLSGQAGFQGGETQVESESRIASGHSRIEQYSFGLTSSYELDLWGRVRAGKEAAALGVSASREDLNAAAVTVAASVAERWARIISETRQIQLLRNQLQTNETFLELTELRFEAALVSALDVFQQREVLARTKAQIPLREQQQQLLRNELALLLGKAPEALPAVERTDLPQPKGVPKAGLPADLLARRPDIRAAGWRLQSSDWQVAEARADRLPAIRLTAGLDYQAGVLDLLLDNWVLSLAANITAPIFDGNLRKAEVDRTQAVADENLAAYRRTVLTAIKEVEDQLINEQKLGEHIEALGNQLSAARNGLTEARERYRMGLNDYLPVLTQLLTVQGLERDLIQRRTDLLLARIGLYRALGGTWNVTRGTDSAT